MNRRHVATNTGVGSVQGSAPSTDGEEIDGVGSRYSATLNERQNKSLNRNFGPERPSANPRRPGMVTREARKTGRL